MPFDSEGLEQGIGLALSGGGFRAVLFHLGAVQRLNDSALLPLVKRVSSVSGGAIAAGVLALAWPRLQFDGSGRAANLQQAFIDPLRAFCGRTIDAGAVALGAVLPWKTAGEEVMDSYREHLGMGVALKDLPEPGPRFVFNATNFATGVSFRFSKAYCGDWRIGLAEDLGVDLAFAVGCSSAFPPLLSPIDFQPDPARFREMPGADLYGRVEFRKRLQLSDGGVYDNLGLETVWNRCSTVLVSDGGKPFEVKQSIWINEPNQVLRVMDIGLNQALALRKRMLVDQFRRGDRDGTYWGIGTQIRRYELPDALPVAPAKIEALSTIRTRLDRFNEQEQCELINWGYAVSDAALRRHTPELAGGFRPGGLPCPRFPLAD